MSMVTIRSVILLCRRNVRKDPIRQKAIGKGAVGKKALGLDYSLLNNRGKCRPNPTSYAVCMEGNFSNPASATPALIPAIRTSG